MDAKDLMQLSTLYDDVHLREPQVHHDENGNVIHKLWGKRHCTNGAAVQWNDGAKEFWVNDRRFRDVDAWARAALAWEFKCINQESINEKIQCAMQCDLF